MNRDEDANLGRGIVHMMLFGAAAIDVVITIVSVYICTMLEFCDAVVATDTTVATTTTLIQFFIVWFSVSRETAGWRCVFFSLAFCLTFLRLLFSLFFMYTSFFSSSMIVVYIFSLRARKIFSYHFFAMFLFLVDDDESKTRWGKKPFVYFFVPHFLFVLKAFRMLCISTVPVWIAMYSHRTLLRFIYVYVALFYVFISLLLCSHTEIFFSFFSTFFLMLLIFISFAVFSSYST